MESLSAYPVTLGIIIVTVLISIQGFNNPEVVYKLRHWPSAEKNQKEYYRFLSSGFVHGSWIHLIINMFVLYEFGKLIEKYFSQLFGTIPGPILFLVVYVLMIILADIPSYAKHKDNPSFASIGASGAVSGILMMYVVFHPWHKIYLYGILGIYSILAAVLYIGYSTWADKQQKGRIDHSAHLYGAILGLIFIFALKPSLISLFIKQLLQGPF
jgi:membrane associated rhomboid family serine protease